MGNTRRFNPSRRQKVLGLKAQNQKLVAQVGYLEGLAAARTAQLNALQMERPADLDDWIESIIPDLDPEELAQWEAMNDAERETFIDQLGQRISASEKLLAPSPSSTDSTA